MNKGTSLTVAAVLGVAALGGLMLIASLEPEPDPAAVATTEPAIERAGEGEASADIDALDRATAALGQAGDAAGEMAADLADQAGESLDAALTVENFDYLRVREAIAESDLSDTEKQTLVGALDGAREAPGLLQQVLKQIREALEV